MKRIGEKIDGEIPPSQAAYRKGRSTTEHVFSTKLVIERTLTSMNETVYLLMYDMSKAFDSINRATLIKDLDKILQKDELHLVNKMLNVELSVKRGSCNSEYFKKTRKLHKVIVQVSMNLLFTSLSRYKSNL